MINFNGTIVSEDQNSLSNNRAFLYGDGVFETMKVLDGKILFFEDHYFRLMASMRILRMEIPMDFTMTYFEDQILQLVKNLEIENSARVRFTVFRNNGGLYLPKNRTISFIVQANSLENFTYTNQTIPYEIEIFKDFHIGKHLLSTLKTTNRLINITASIFAEENDYQNCFLINETKNITETINGNIFMVSGNTITTPPLSEGCMNGILRKKLISLIQKDSNFELLEAPISPFELQKADELFTTNVISGIQSVSKYRKKEYQNNVANKLTDLLNAQIRLN